MLVSRCDAVISVLRGKCKMRADYLWGGSRSPWGNLSERCSPWTQADNEPWQAPCALCTKPPPIKTVSLDHNGLIMHPHCAVLFLLFSSFWCRTEQEKNILHITKWTVTCRKPTWQVLRIFYPRLFSSLTLGLCWSRWAAGRSRWASWGDAYEGWQRGGLLPRDGWMTSSAATGGSRKGWISKHSWMDV